MVDEHDYLTQDMVEFMKWANDEELQNIINEEEDMEKEEEVRYLRLRLAESKDETEKGYILKQLELLEAKELAENQTLLSE